MCMPPAGKVPVICLHIFCKIQTFQCVKTTQPDTTVSLQRTSSVSLLHCNWSTELDVLLRNTHRNVFPKVVTDLSLTNPIACSQVSCSPKLISYTLPVYLFLLLTTPCSPSSLPSWSSFTDSLWRHAVPWIATKVFKVSFKWREHTPPFSHSHQSPNKILPRTQHSPNAASSLIPWKYVSVPQSTVLHKQQMWKSSVPESFQNFRPTLPMPLLTWFCFLLPLPQFSQSLRF